MRLASETISPTPPTTDLPKLFGRHTVAIYGGLVNIIESDDFFGLPSGQSKCIRNDKSIGFQFFFKFGFQRCHAIGKEIANDYFSVVE